MILNRFTQVLDKFKEGKYGTWEELKKDFNEVGDAFPDAATILFGVDCLDDLINAAPEQSTEPAPELNAPQQHEESSSPKLESGQESKEDESPAADDSFYQDPLIQEALSVFKGTIQQ